MDSTVLMLLLRALQVMICSLSPKAGSTLDLRLLLSGAGLQSVQ
jgi:hypothetical protein